MAFIATAALLFAVVSATCEPSMYYAYRYSCPNGYNNYYGNCCYYGDMPGWEIGMWCAICICFCLVIMMIAAAKQRARRNYMNAQARNMQANSGGMAVTTTTYNNGMSNGAGRASSSSGKKRNHYPQTSQPGYGGGAYQQPLMPQQPGYAPAQPMP